MHTTNHDQYMHSRKDRAGEGGAGGRWPNDFLEGVWQQRGRTLAQGQEQNPIHSPFAFHCKMSTGRILSSHPLFPSWLSTGNCLGTCVCLRQIGEAMALVNVHGAHSNWMDSSTFWPKDSQKPLPNWLHRGSAADSLPRAGLYIYGNLLGHLPSEKTKLCIEVEA